MFNAAEVDELFASTARALQRSQVLLDERRTSAIVASVLPSTFCQPTSSAASMAVGAGATSGYSSSSNSFTDTVCSLQSLGQFRGFVEATTAMQAKLQRELKKPSPALQQRRGKGQDFALLQSVTRGLCDATAAPWRSSDATASLWSPRGDAEDGDDGEGGTDNAATLTASTASSSTSTEGHFAALNESTSLMAHSSRTSSSGAEVTATLLFGAFCVDVALAVPRAAPAIAADVMRVFEPASTSSTNLGTVGSGSEDGADSSHATGRTAGGREKVTVFGEWTREETSRLRGLLHDAAAFLPKSAVGHFLGRAAELLFRSLPSTHGGAFHLTAPPHSRHLLSGGQLLFPALDCHLLEHYPSSLAAKWFVRPLQATAQHLRAEYYRSADDFRLQCRWVLSFVFVLVRACLAASAASSAHAAEGRHVRTVQRIYDAWLMPLEKTFGHDAARHGMSAHFAHALVYPHAKLTHQFQEELQGRAAAAALAASAKGVEESSRVRIWSSVFYTAHYRLLLVLEKLAQSEVAQANGTSSTAAKQRTYEALLRQNGGKFTVALLQTLAEDRQMILEETPSRSPDGHRLYRLHDGIVDGAAAGAAKAVFVYVDDGALFTKVGRSRAFQRVKSVEDIFRPLQ